MKLDLDIWKITRRGFSNDSITWFDKKKKTNKQTNKPEWLKKGVLKKNVIDNVISQ